MRSPVFGLLLIVLIFVALAVGAYYFFNPGASTPEGPAEAPTAPRLLTQRFSDETYGVSGNYPAGWSISTSSLADLTPALNLYIPVTGENEPPYTHWSNVTQVSFFPQGIPTEGITAESIQTEFEQGTFAATNTRMFLLEDGTPFAAYLQPLEQPRGWDQYGFVWVSARVEDLSQRCVNASGAIASSTACEIPMVPGHRVVWGGTRSSAEWEEALSILRSVRFSE